MKLKLNAIPSLTDNGAMVTYHKQTCSIAEHIKNAKLEGSKGWVLHGPTKYKGEEKLPSKSLKIGPYYLPLEFESIFHKTLWLQYLKQNPEQIELLQQYDEFEHPVLESFMIDSFGEVMAKSEQGKALVHEVKPFMMFLNRKKVVLTLKQDILKSFTPLIFHQVNCQGNLTHGLAGRLAQKERQLFFAYRNHILCLREKALGTTFWFPGSNHVIVNSFSQLYFSQEAGQTNYDALTATLIHTKEEAKKRGWPIAIPYGLGCGIEDKEWEEMIYPIIEKVFSDYYCFICMK